MRNSTVSHAVGLPALATSSLRWVKPINGSYHADGTIAGAGSGQFNFHAVALWAWIWVMARSHLCRSSSRFASTYFLASSKLGKRWRPFSRLQGRQAATRLCGSFLPRSARGMTKSTVIIRPFSKLAAPSKPQYWHLKWSRVRIFIPSSRVRGLTRRMAWMIFFTGMEYLLGEVSVYSMRLDGGKCQGEKAGLKPGAA